MNTFVAALLIIQLTPITGPPPEPPQIDLSTAGLCEGSSGSIDMRRVMFLENRSIVVDGVTGLVRLWFEDETFYSEEIGERSDRRTYFNRIDALVQPGQDLDIELKFAFVNRRLVVYWRETYRHRAYRQGMLTIEGRALFGNEQQAMQPLCTGEGGSFSVS